MTHGFLTTGKTIFTLFEDGILIIPVYNIRGADR